MPQNVKRGTYPGEQMKPLGADDPRAIGEYRLRAQLGAGGMGRVYLGLSPAGRAVAIKVVHPDLASDAAFLRRFGQEVAAARAVSGIYTAPVVASGLDERPPWLATAFVPGPPLDQVVGAHGPLPEPALWPLLAGLVEALQAIHACGVVHRDLKPANVLLAADGPRVIDFGIARAVDGTSLTAAGVVFGTRGYMSPEQAEGRGAGPASDVFALGCVLAYAAAGMGPFGTGTAAAILYRVVHAEPVLDGVPPRLREVIAGCLAKDPAARPTLRALSGVTAGGMDTTGPSAVAFWPPSVARLIGAYQARLEQETRSTRPADAGGFSWATTVQSAQPPAQQLPAPGWPYSGPGGPQVSPASRRATAPLPPSMVTAVRLMYAGAAYTLFWAIGTIAVAASIVKQHPVVSDHRLAGAVTLAVLLGAAEIALWLGIARACRRGRSGARLAGTVLFALHTVGLLSVLGSSQAGLGPAKVLTLVGWLIGLGAVVALWQRPSSAFFSARTPASR